VLPITARSRHTLSLRIAVRRQDTMQFLKNACPFVRKGYLALQIGILRRRNGIETYLLQLRASKLARFGPGDHGGGECRCRSFDG